MDEYFVYQMIQQAERENQAYLRADLTEDATAEVKSEPEKFPVFNVLVFTVLLVSSCFLVLR